MRTLIYVDIGGRETEQKKAQCRDRNWHVREQA